VALDHVDGQLELIESFSPQLEILELDLSAPYADLQLLGIEVLDVHAQEPVQQRGNQTLQHLGGVEPLPGSGKGGTPRRMMQLVETVRRRAQIRRDGSLARSSSSSAARPVGSESSNGEKRKEQVRALLGRREVLPGRKGSFGRSVRRKRKSRFEGQGSCAAAAESRIGARDDDAATPAAEVPPQS
jgi:hypothetical protein